MKYPSQNEIFSKNLVSIKVKKTMKSKEVNIELLQKISNDVWVFLLQNDLNVLTVEYTDVTIDAEPFLPRIFS